MGIGGDEVWEPALRALQEDEEDEEDSGDEDCGGGPNNTSYKCGEFAVSWVYDASAGTMTFDLDCATTGWCAFGLGAGSKFHSLGDSVTAWVSGGTAQTLEGTTRSEDQPKTRSDKVYTILAGGEAAGRTTVTLERALGGSYGQDLEDTVQEMYWGWHGSDPSGGSYEEHEEYGSFIANFLDPSVEVRDTSDLEIINPGNVLLVLMIVPTMALALYRFFDRRSKITAQYALEVEQEDADEHGATGATANATANADSLTDADGIADADLWKNARSTSHVLTTFRPKSQRTGFSLWLLQLGRRRLPSSRVTVLQMSILLSFVVATLLAVYPLRLTEVFVEDAFGYAAAALALLTVVCATRNSLLTLTIRVPFEHMLLYHRALGRLTIAAAVAHTAYYVAKWDGFAGFFENTFESPTYIFGFVSLVALLFMFVTSLGFVRRRYYQSFKLAHYAFVVFVGFGMIHSLDYFLVLGLATFAFFAVDIALRERYGLFSQPVLEVATLPGNVVRVRWPKNKNTAYEAGQYVFLNFPSISLMEWHPLTISSGPHEPNLTVHIKGLGDWTRKLTAKAKALGEHGPLPRVRVDGPYGRIGFNLRRYETIVLLGGGIGMTPTLAILKDIYQIGRSDEAPPSSSFSPLIKHVHVVFVVRELESWTWLLNDLKQIVQRSGRAVGTCRYPVLHVYGYVTKPSPQEDLSLSASDMQGAVGTFSLAPGRPKCDEVLARVEANNASDVQRIAICACGPNKLVKSMWNASLSRANDRVNYDLHREIFEF